ncbi:MAG: 50S ribosomal protein L19, partial [Verrucomicrobiota bacterium]|nr:50S ribosomal protein L19 [Verrucomicrobiota bacterium]
MNQEILNKIESEHYRKEPLEFNVGDSVKVHTKVVEGEKERIQVFSGLVIGRRVRPRRQEHAGSLNRPALAGDEEARGAAVGGLIDQRAAAQQALDHRRVPHGSRRVNRRAPVGQPPV